MDTIGWFTLLITVGLSGWIAGVMFGENERSSIVIHSIAGLMGAGLGAALFLLFTRPLTAGFDSWGQLCAFVGAAICSGILRPLTHRRMALRH